MLVSGDENEEDMEEELEDGDDELAISETGTPPDEGEQHAHIIWELCLLCKLCGCNLLMDELGSRSKLLRDGDLLPSADCQSILAG